MSRQRCLLRVSRNIFWRFSSLMFSVNVDLKFSVINVKTLAPSTWIDYRYTYTRGWCWNALHARFEQLFPWFLVLYIHNFFLVTLCELFWWCCGSFFSFTVVDFILLKAVCTCLAIFLKQNNDLCSHTLLMSKYAKIGHRIKANSIFTNALRKTRASGKKT